MHRSTVLTLGALALLTLPVACAHARSSYDVDLICEGRACPESSKRGQRWVLGEFGERYVIRVHNRSNRWVEAVITVDGRDVVNGSRGAMDNRGYLIGPYDSVDVEGFRVSSQQVAAFRFTSVPDSYAGRVDGGVNAGVVGVAFFPEKRRRRPTPRPIYIPERQPRPEPYGGRAPSSDRDLADNRARGDEAEAAPARTSKSSRGGGYYEPAPRQNLGTQYGERRHSAVSEVDFVRARAHRPHKLLTIRYDDRSGLIARGVSLPRPAYVEAPPRRTRWTPPPPNAFPGR